MQEDEVFRTSPKQAPRADRLASMIQWLRDNGDSITYATDRETVEYRIECRFPGGLRAFSVRGA